MAEKEQAILIKKLHQMANQTFGDKPGVQQAVVWDAVSEEVIRREDLAKVFKCAEAHVYKHLRTLKSAKLASHLSSLGFGSSQ